MERVVTFIRRFLLVFLAVPQVILIRLISPLVLVRFKMVGIERIGSVYPLLYYLSDIRVGMTRRRCWDIFYFSPYTEVVSNVQWKKMVERNLFFFPIPRLALAIDKINRYFPGHEQHVIQYGHPPENRVLKNVFDYKEAIFSFTQGEDRFGKKALSALGITQGESFICFHTRDSAYLNAIDTQKNWGYHDYRDTSIKNYLLAIESYLKRVKCKAVRMGAVVGEKLVTDNPNIIDYASNGKRTDFLDIYLGARCKFFVGTDCGITIVPEAFKRPVVYANWVSIQLLPHYVADGIIIMKKWYSLKDKRFLTFREILNVAKPHGIDAKKMGVQFTDNTPEEILCAMEEMDARINGTWESSIEDAKLQKRFWELYGKDTLRSSQMRIGTKFLRENQDLLRW